MRKVGKTPQHTERRGCRPRNRGCWYCRRLTSPRTRATIFLHQFFCCCNILTWNLHSSLSILYTLPVYVRAVSKTPLCAGDNTLLKKFRNYRNFQPYLSKFHSQYFTTEIFCRTKSTSALQVFSVITRLLLILCGTGTEYFGLVVRDPVAMSGGMLAAPFHFRIKIRLSNCWLYKYSF